MSNANTEALDVTGPEPEPRGYPGNLGTPFAAHADSTRTAIVDLYFSDSPREVSYRALDAMCNAVARGLAKVGLNPGDRIGIAVEARHRSGARTRRRRDARGERQSGPARARGRTRLRVRGRPATPLLRIREPPVGVTGDDVTAVAT